MGINIGFPDGSAGRESACNAGDTEDTSLIPGSEGPLEKEMATHCNILAWEIPWTKEPVRHIPQGHKESGTPEHAHTSISMLD